MADTRTLKLSLLADVNKFTAGMNEAETSTKGLSGKIGKYSKAMAGAFLAVGAAAGAMAIKIGVDAVKAAIEDEKSQKDLATALRNVTDATDIQISSTEKWITKQQLAYGITDTKLRPALANLTRATGKVTEAQSLTNLAMDISVSTGKDLETVSLALGKAYNGNIGALGKLGIPLDESIKKSGDFKLVQQELTDLFGGAAKANTETYAGQLAIVKERVSELQEGIGVGLLPILKTLLEQVNKVAKGFSGEDPQGLSNRARELAGQFEGDGAYTLGGSLRAVADAFGQLFSQITSGDGKSAASSLERIASALETFAKAINLITDAYEGYFKFYNKVPDGLKSFMNPVARLAGYVNMLDGSRATGGPVSAGGSYLVGENGPEILNMGSRSGNIIPNNQIGGGGVTINLNGIVDAESARRSIEQLIQRSARRTGAIDWVGATL
ncbi:hypothetical protein UFOVP482_18 [uncultured Caudovirales phage]|uniref:Bacteriophage lambda, GpH, tail tape measure, C-terminal n=1 Tax=uncultured Caudovirales phage TaxID=2100421 RepID=A0A6J5MG78_9CAUD|nr:hypothetical protein UFOVP482_18 [uncultured Caudovirales phage]